MKIFILVLISMVPIEAFADRYECINRRHTGRATFEVSSDAEAQYKFKEIYGQYATPVCTNISISESSDIFVRDVHFSHNMQLRPYIPSDLKPNGKAGYACDSSGGFKADKDPITGGCSVFMSSSPVAEWRIRYANQGAATKVWRKTQGTWELWVEFEPPPNLYSVINASPQARQYAASHGASPQPASSQRGIQTDNSVRSSPIAKPNPNPNPVDDVINKGVGDLLRKLGQ